MSPRRLVPAAVVAGAALLSTSHEARGDTPPAPTVLAPPPAAPAPVAPTGLAAPAPAAAPSGTIATMTDTTAPVCATSRTRCETADEDATRDVDISQQTMAVSAVVRELRRCFDRTGAPQVPASIAIRWGDQPRSQVIAPGYEGSACVADALRAMSTLASSERVSLRCTYECSGERLAAPAPVVAPLPAGAMVTTEPAPQQAAPAPAAPAPPPATVRATDGDTWYGWQTLIADGASIATLAAGLGTWTVEPTAIGYGAFLLGTPILHAVHGNVGRLFGSFAMRLFIPPVAGSVGALAGLLSGDDPSLEQIASAAGIGAAIGAGACVLLDLGVLAWERPTPASTGRAPATGPTFGVLVGPTTSVYGTF